MGGMPPGMPPNMGMGNMGGMNTMNTMGAMTGINTMGGMNNPMGNMNSMNNMNDDDGNDGMGGGPGGEAREQDRYLPVANIARIMKTVLPPNAKIGKDAKETIQECVSEFISFITSEASDKCVQEKRKTINGDDILWAMSTLGFDPYIQPLEIYLTKYRDVAKADKPEKKVGGPGSGGKDGSDAPTPYAGASAAPNAAGSGPQPGVSTLHHLTAGQQHLHHHAGAPNNATLSAYSSANYHPGTHHPSGPSYLVSGELPLSNTSPSLTGTVSGTTLLSSSNNSGNTTALPAAHHASLLGPGASAANSSATGANGTTTSTLMPGSYLTSSSYIHPHSHHSSLPPTTMHTSPKMPLQAFRLYFQMSDRKDPRDDDTEKLRSFPRTKRFRVR